MRVRNDLTEGSERGTYIRLNVDNEELGMAYPARAVRHGTWIYSWESRPTREVRKSSTGGSQAGVLILRAKEVPRCESQSRAGYHPERGQRGLPVERLYRQLFTPFVSQSLWENLP